MNANNQRSLLWFAVAIRRILSRSWARDLNRATRYKAIGRVLAPTTNVENILSTKANDKGVRQ
ncbi:MAG: hypothetical protein KGL39_23820 [Patescibacteria group bacterium]|nr:hypothetical protein [Patescibacteria group bacterium]